MKAIFIFVFAKATQTRRRRTWLIWFLLDYVYKIRYLQSWINFKSLDFKIVQLSESWILRSGSLRSGSFLIVDGKNCVFAYFGWDFWYFLKGFVLFSTIPEVDLGLLQHPRWMLCDNSYRLSAVNYDQKALHLGCCSSPRYVPAIPNFFVIQCVIKVLISHWLFQYFFIAGIASQKAFCW